MSFVGTTRLIAVIVAACATATGCTEPPAAESNLILTPDEERSRVMLDESEEREAIRALRSVADGETARNRPVTAPNGRWSDVTRAAYAAAKSVEIAVLRPIELDGGRTYRFDLKTLEDLPGVLIVHRDAETVYRAEASVGLFPDAPRSIEHRDALLRAFDDAMRTFGENPQFEDEWGGYKGDLMPKRER